MYYYQNGSDIFESDFVSGNMSYADRQTHAGIFTLDYKKSPDVLRGTMKADGTYEYESEVQYWMPFDGGIGFMMRRGEMNSVAIFILRTDLTDVSIFHRIMQRFCMISYSMVCQSYAFTNI